MSKCLSRAATKESRDLTGTLLTMGLLIGCCSTLVIPLAYSEETPVTLKNINSTTLERFKSPKLIDDQEMQEKARQIHAGLKALVHMSEMISEEHARRAMKAQIDSIKATLESLETQLKSAPSVDYGFPAPLPTSRREPHGQSKTTQADQSTESSTAAVDPRSASTSTLEQPMSASTLSQLWGAIERASFRDDKMSVIRQVNRDHYLNTQQAELLIEALTFSKDRRDAVKLLYPKLIDPSKIETLYRLLDQPAHRREVKAEVDQINMNRRLRRAQGGGSGY